MAPRKAAKKSAKKSAKKHAAKHAGHHAQKDARRAYEHLGRLEAMQNALSSATAGDVARLTTVAQRAMQQDDTRSAADLLRAAEHVAFAELASPSKEKVGNLHLEDALLSEFEHLRTRAEDHWDDSDDRDEVVTELYTRCLENGETANAKGSYRRAMEFIRAADALAHVELTGVKQLPQGKKAVRLAGK
jgi:hypothetical protein